MTDKCTNPKCGKDLIHTGGRRPKKYCSPSCRNAHYKVVYEKKEDVIVIPKKEYQALLDKIEENNKPENKAKIEAERNSLTVEWVNETGLDIVDHPKLEIDKEFIQKQISEIRAEKIPEYRNTPLGKKVWQQEQDKRINELKQQIN